MIKYSNAFIYRTLTRLMKKLAKLLFASSIALGISSFGLLYNNGTTQIKVLNEYHGSVQERLSQKLIDERNKKERLAVDMLAISIIGGGIGASLYSKKREN